MIEPYVVNVSSIQMFMQCRFRWICQWVENRVPLFDARPLRFGKLYHKINEWHMGNGVSMGRALMDARVLWEMKMRDSSPDTPDHQDAYDALEDLDTLWEPMKLWHDQYPFEIPVLEVEQPFEIEHPLDPSIRLKGRPDRVGVRQGRVYHVQNRSLAAGVNFPLYIELSKRSYHEHVYAEALDQKYGVEGLARYPEGLGNWIYGLPYGGTHFNLYRKLKYRKKQTKKQLELNEPGDILHPVSEIFWQHPMDIDLNSPLHKHVMESILKHAQAMRETERRYREFGEVPAPNEKLNGGPYGNRLDEYYRVLTGEIQLNDDAYFKERQDTYASVDSGID